MISPADLPRARRGDAGFTLLELIVVFAILGLVLVLYVSRANGPSAGLTLRASANELAAGLREARSAAIAGNRPVGIAVDAPRKIWRAVDGTIKSFPPRAAVSVIYVADGASAVGIEFEPDGSSTGGRVELTQDKQRIAVGVDWLTGRVTVANAR